MSGVLFAILILQFVCSTYLIFYLRFHVPLDQRVDNAGRQFFNTTVFDTVAIKGSSTGMEFLKRNNP